MLESRGIVAPPIVPVPRRFDNDRARMPNMPEITVTQFQLVQNVFSFTLSVMGIATAFFFLQRGEVLPRYRAVVAISGLVTMVACYNYFQLYTSWNLTYVISAGIVKFTGHPYNDTFRYADWLVTVPLLVVALVLVLDLPAQQARLRALVLGVLAAEMILLGYPGQIATTTMTRWLWWSASMVPFLIIVYQLYISLADAVANQPAGAREMVVQARFITVLVWCFYPVVYILPLIGVTGSDSFVGTQLGYAGADMLAKVAYGVMIYNIAVKKTEIERTPVPVEARATRRVA